MVNPQGPNYRGWHILFLSCLKFVAAKIQAETMVLYLRGTFAKCCFNACSVQLRNHTKPQFVHFS